MLVLVWALGETQGMTETETQGMTATDSLILGEMHGEMQGAMQGEIEMLVVLNSQKTVVGNRPFAI